MARLRKQYFDEFRSNLKKSLNLTNVMQVPRLEKIVVNIGVGEAIGDNKKLDAAVADFIKQHPQQPSRVTHVMAYYGLAEAKPKKGPLEVRPLWAIEFNRGRYAWILDGVTGEVVKIRE